MSLINFFYVFMITHKYLYENYVQSRRIKLKSIVFKNKAALIILVFLKHFKYFIKFSRDEKQYLSRCLLVISQIE